MLLVSAVLSVGLLIVMNFFAFRRQRPIDQRRSICMVIAICACLFFLFCLMPAIAVHGLFLAVAVGLWRPGNDSPWSFARLSCGATVFAYGIAGWLAWQSVRDYARLSALYPFESMETRLAASPPVVRAATLSPAALQRLNSLENTLSADPGGLRGYYLKIIHERAVESFINSPGFGAIRAIRPTEGGLKALLPKIVVPDQPGTRIPSTWSPGDLDRLSADEERPLTFLQPRSVEDFAFLGGWGYIKDRRHVAGFLSHRFSRVPDAEYPSVPSTKPVIRWTVRTLDLVGLLLHEQPVVYVSERLPAMDELREVPMRPLDKFESLGLTALRAGEDLFISRDGPAALRMLGAISSTKQCIVCHGGQRGDLLGAFSYSLERDR